MYHRSAFDSTKNEEKEAETRFDEYHSDDDSDGAGTPVIRKRKIYAISDSASSTDSDDHQRSRHYCYHENNKRTKLIDHETIVDDEQPNYYLLQRLNYNQSQTMTSGIIRQNNCAQSSTFNEYQDYHERISSTTIVSENVEHYARLMENDTTKEQCINGAIMGQRDDNLSMLKEAIRDCGEHVDLHLVEIEVLTQKFGVHSVEVQNKWDSIMNTYPNDLKIWKRHLTYYRSKGSSFSAEPYFKNSIFKCLETLGSIVASDTKSHPKQESTEEFIMDVIVSAAVLHIELGALHKAIAILQALIEFYFMNHKHLELTTFERKLGAFESFWKSGIPKIGNQHAKGWKNYPINTGFTGFNYRNPEKSLAKKEQEKRKKRIGQLFIRNVEYMKSVRIHNESQQWSTIEKRLTESLWVPSYANESVNGGLQVPFNEIQPYLLQLENDKKTIVQHAIFRILGRLGAVIPAQIDHSHESIFNQCKIIPKDESFKLQFIGIHDFIDNVLSQMSASNDTSGKLYLFCGIARILTRKSILLKKGSNCSEAVESFMKFVQKIRESLELIRPINPQENLIMASYISQMVDEIHEYYGNAFVIQENRFRSISQQNIFHTTQSRIAVFAQLRYLVMCCRSLPYHDEINNFGKPSKLKFLLQIVLNQENPDIHSKKVKNDAITLFKDSKLIESDFNLPAATNWIGNPNAFAIELFALLCYEAEEEGLKKFDAFAANFNDNLLDEQESLTEVYFLTWEHHLRQYRQKETEFMARLKSTITKFPRNICFTQMLARHMEPIELKTYFAIHEIDDDVVKILRSCVEASLIQTSPEQDQDPSKRISFISAGLQRSAELSSNCLIPESFLWRMLLLHVKRTSENFDEVFSVARDQCPWSKTFLMYAAFLNTQSDFLNNNIDYARKVNMNILCDETYLEELMK